MKKILHAFFSGIFVLLSLNVHAQLTLQAIKPQTVILGSPAQQTLETNFDLLNTGTQAIAVKVKSDVTSTPIPGTENYFCWSGICFSSAITTSPFSETIQPNATTTFTGYYAPNNIPGNTTVKYTFFLESDPSQETSITVDYRAGAVSGLNSKAQEIAYLKEVYPNPVKDGITTISYNLPASARAGKIILFNAIGSVVKEIPLKANQGNIVLTTEGLANGIYFFTLEANGRALATQKLIIAQ